MRFLTDEEVDALCHPLTQAAAQVRFLRRKGLYVDTKSNGRPIVVDTHAEAVFSGRKDRQVVAGDTEPTPEQPNRSAMMLLYKGQNGAPPKIKSA